MAGLLALYLVFAISYGAILIGVGTPVAVGLGVALLALAVLAGWALVVEVLFTVRAERLVRRLEAEGGLPDEELPTLPSGRTDPRAAEPLLPAYAAAAEAAPDDWRAWFRLGIVSDAAGDRRAARAAIRRSVRLARGASAE
jgi:hypothetical protein